MMTLPEQLQKKLVEKINRFEGERKMPLISPTEQMAMERGKEIGQEIGKEIGKEIGTLEKARDNVRIVLEARLGQVPAELPESLAQIADKSILDEILKLAATVNSLEDFKKALEFQLRINLSS